MAYSAIILGLVSSLHCMGMCGPIVLSVNNVFGNQSLKSLFYQMGRITTYFILGCLVGVFGELLMLSEVQRIITLVCGFILILVGVNTTLLEYNFIIRKLSFINKFTKSQFNDYFTKKGVFSRFVLGMLNGLLPCGMVLIALMSSLSQASLLESGLFMALFGLGTLPAFVFITFIQNKFNFNNKMIMKVSLIVMGGLFLLRGLELGVPYLSPVVEIQNEEVHSTCCHKK